jgi:uncharacterized membrane protein
VNPVLNLHQGTRMPHMNLNLSQKYFLPIVVTMSVLVSGCFDKKSTGLDEDQAPYELVLLSTEGALDAFAASISPNGLYVGGTVGKTNGGGRIDVAAIWNLGGNPSGTRTDALPAAGLNAGVNAVDNAGHGAGWTTNTADADWPTFPAHIVDGIVTVLPSLSAPLEFGSARAFRNGISVGTASDEDEDFSKPWVRKNGATRSLGSFGGESGMATGVNANGQICGWSQTGDSVWKSEGFFVGSDDSLAMATRISGLGGNLVFARALNDAGVVVGDASDSNGRSHSFMWTTAGGTVKIGSPPEGVNYTLTRSVNNQNEVVGDGPSTAGPPEAWHWTQAGGKRLLNALVTLPSGWSIRQAWAIADNGTIVVTVRDADGDDHAAVLRPR